MDTATRPPLSIPQSYVWGALALVLLGVVGFGGWTLLAPHVRHEPPQELPVYGTVPPFSLVERSGRPLTAEDLAGKIWIADFIFTHCPGLCPALSARMAGLQRTLRNTAAVLVSFSVDPERDTPEALTRYAERYRADAERWLFVTGRREDLYQLILEGFRVSVAHLPPDDPRVVNEPIVHSDRFVLVDSRLRIRGYYRGTEAESVAQLLRDVETLQGEQHQWSTSLTFPASTHS
ncbi:MAG: SCO family protein [Thermodesulfobacteriota bacterium]